MKNRILCSAFAATALLFTGCNKEEVIEFNQDINVTIQGVTYDADGNVPLEGVSVYLVGDESDTSDENGVYRFTGKETGNHLVKFEKDGFATMVQTVEADGNELTAEELTKSSIIEMYHTNEAASTTLKITNGTETTPAANVPVTIELNATGDAYFESDKIETTTDADGLLSLTGLPDVVLTITVETTQGTDLYTTTINSTPGALNSSYTLTKSSLLEDLELVDSNIIEDDTANVVEDFVADSNIIFTFSNDIDTNYSGMEVKLVKTSNNIDIAIDTTISGSTLTIDPIGDNLESGASYEVSVTVQSLDASGTYSESFTFTVEGEELTLNQVTGLSLDQAHNEETGTDIQEITTFFIIQFDEVEGADSYEVYGSYSPGGTNEYILLSTRDFTTSTDDELEYGVNLLTSGIDVPTGTTGYFDEGATLSIIVRAKSGDTYGEYSNVLVVAEGSDLNS